MATRAWQFFEQITKNSDPTAYLRSLVATRKAESEFLDFKGGAKVQERDVKRLWSQALSGFANTEGGVVVWGIEAKRQMTPEYPSGVDAATNLDLVPSPASFAQLLKDTLLEATVDAVRGVEIVPYGTDPTGSGFVVCHIPEGKHKPYRGELEQSRQYWQRIQDRFVVLPHALLRSLFYPQTQPDLSVTITVRFTQNGGRLGIQFDSILSNRGTASAADLCVCVHADSPLERLATGYSSWIEEFNSSAHGKLLVRAKQPLHPLQTIELFHAQWLSRETWQPYPIEDARLCTWRPEFDIRFHILTYMQHQEPVSLLVDFGKNDLGHLSSMVSVPSDDFRPWPYA